MLEVLVESIEICHVLPCLADPAKIRFHAEASDDMAAVLPYLNSCLPGAIYNHALPALTFSKDQRIICLHNRLITGARLDDVEDARAVLDWLVELINDTWARRGEIQPSYERRERLTPLTVYKLLPRTNCRRCGLATCLAFAAEVAAERRSPVQCAPLLDAEHAQERRLLLSLLADAGYEVPAAFLPSDDQGA